VSALVFTLKTPPRQRVDLTPLTPERLRDIAPGDIARIELASGNRRIPAGELFAVAPGDPAEIVIRNAVSRLDFIGRDMRDGAITVEGDAGAYLGQGLGGGRIRVTGSVGPWAAAEMQGGSIVIDGDAGDFLGAALPGAMRGMSGGLVAVRGRAGERAGDRMRRGIIVVHGAAGAYAGSRMIAGTLAILGHGSGAYPGLGMKRGTLLFPELPQSVLPSFVDCGTHELGFLSVLHRTLRDLDSDATANIALATRVRRYVGDTAADGKGEILVWQ
jgi:formylmethanofuran dehydrogenase subunit C